MNEFPGYAALTLMLISIFNSCGLKNNEISEETWSFVSMPDFLNVDCDYPQVGWENALSYILVQVKEENPEFVTVSGDLVMGHWDNESWSDIDTIAKYSARYYSAWKERMAAHDLKYFTSIGDHEIGDNPWKSDKKLNAVKYYKKAFANHLGMPRNGPDHMKGTAFWWRHKNVLFISVDVFESGQSNQGFIKAGVSGVQLQWMEEALMQNNEVDHKIVLGHTPVLGPVRKWSSSGLMVKEGRNSDFWKSMKKFGVDAYLCGEVHAITCKERDGIMQIAHGGLIGYNSRTNYMVVTITKNKIKFEIKEIEMMPSGNHLWQTKNNRPLEKVTISTEHKEKGFYIVGLATLEKTDQKKYTDRQGYFEVKYESSDDWAVPVFRSGNPRSQGLPKIRIE